MKLSGHVYIKSDHLPKENESNTSNLSASELSLLDTFYKSIVAQYRYLCEQYEKAKTLAVNARRKASFPTQANWQPICGFQNNNDRLLVQGPKPVIIEKKKMEYEDVITGRKSVFMSTQHEPLCSSGRHLSSIVQVLKTDPDNDHSDCIVAYISKLFVHQFGEDLHTLALLRIYDVKSDDDSKLFWGATDKFKQELSILPLNWLSSPLVVGFEENKIFFLNCKL